MSGALPTLAEDRAWRIGVYTLAALIHLPLVVAVQQFGAAIATARPVESVITLLDAPPVDRARLVETDIDRAEPVPAAVLLPTAAATPAAAPNQATTPGSDAPSIASLIEADTIAPLVDAAAATAPVPAEAVPSMTAPVVAPETPAVAAAPDAPGAVSAAPTAAVPAASVEAAPSPTVTARATGATPVRAASVSAPVAAAVSGAPPAPAPSVASATVASVAPSSTASVGSQAATVALAAQPARRIAILATGPAPAARAAMVAPTGAGVSRGAAAGPAVSAPGVAAAPARAVSSADGRPQPARNVAAAVAPAIAAPAARSIDSVAPAIAPAISQPVAEPSPAVAALPPGGAGAERAALNSFVRGYEGGGCFAALTVASGDDDIAVSGFSRDETALAGFQTALGERAGAKSNAAGRQVSQAQCSVLAFARAQPAYPDFPVRLTLEADRIASGGTIAGRIAGAGDRPVTMLILDDEGRIQDASFLLSREPTGDWTFGTPLSLTGDPVPTVQLFVALAGDGPIAAMRPPVPVEARRYFAEIDRILKARGQAMDVALAAFTVDRPPGTATP